jgi:ABC-type uncharacterized transport system substrate-binding protein
VKALQPQHPLLLPRRSQVVAFALESRSPALYETRDHVEVGGSMSYGSDVGAVHRRVASHVDCILKGTAPATCRGRAIRLGPHDQQPAIDHLGLSPPQA